MTLLWLHLLSGWYKRPFFKLFNTPLHLSLIFPRYFFIIYTLFLIYSSHLSCFPCFCMRLRINYFTNYIQISTRSHPVFVYTGTGSIIANSLSDKNKCILSKKTNVQSSMSLLQRRETLMSSRFDHLITLSQAKLQWIPGLLISNRRDCLLMGKRLKRELSHGQNFYSVSFHYHSKTVIVRSLSLRVTQCCLILLDCSIITRIIEDLWNLHDLMRIWSSLLFTILTPVMLNLLWTG